VGLLAAPLVRRERPDSLWTVLAIYGAVIAIFHAIVPTSIEPRKIYQIAPVACLFASVAFSILASLLRRATSLPAAAPVCAFVAALVFFFAGFSLLVPFEPGFGPATRALLTAPATDGAAVLISSNPVLDDFEAGIISQWAERRHNSGTYLLRASKILSDTVTAGETVEFVPYDATPAELRTHLAAIPVAYVVMDTLPARSSYKHHDLLRQAIESAPEDWETVYSSQGLALGKLHELRIFRYRKDVRGIPVRFKIDLSRKIRQDIGVGGSGNGKP
jgi:hypothetical protein